jgi:catechol 2,3-dioxygenase-like lactoylglutathione lyase family enzyme
MAQPMLQSFSALTLAVKDMAQSVKFYRSLGFRLNYGGEDAVFSSFFIGANYLNLFVSSSIEIKEPIWGRAIIYVEDVDRFYQQLLDLGLEPEFAPRDGSWGERYFHIRDPNGHELSFAKPLT